MDNVTKTAIVDSQYDDISIDLRQASVPGSNEAGDVIFKIGDSSSVMDGSENTVSNKVPSDIRPHLTEELRSAIEEMLDALNVNCYDHHTAMNNLHEWMSNFPVHEIGCSLASSSVITQNNIITSLSDSSFKAG